MANPVSLGLKNGELYVLYMGSDDATKEWSCLCYQDPRIVSFGSDFEAGESHLRYASIPRIYRRGDVDPRIPDSTPVVESLEEAEELVQSPDYLGVLLPLRAVKGMLDEEGIQELEEFYESDTELQRYLAVHMAA